MNWNESTVMKSDYNIVNRQILYLNWPQNAIFMKF